MEREVLIDTSTCVGQGQKTLGSIQARKGAW